MAFRSQETARAVVALALWLAPAALAAQEFRYEARHDHLRTGCKGTLTIDGQGVAFHATGKSKHAWTWPYEQIQQLEISGTRLRVLTYDDARWKLGEDREYRFDLVSGGGFADAYQFLKTRLDQRLVAALPDKGVKAIWEMPVKHLLRFGGDQGVLTFGDDRVVYASDKKQESRTWRYPDIDSISSSGPFQLTITTYERALGHYGSLKGFNFQLKRPLREEQYDELWRKVNQSKGLKLVSLDR